MEFEIVDCRNISADRLCVALNDAFSDYVTPLSLTEDRFRDFQVQRGFAAEHSFLVLNGDDIAGFWFSSPPLAAFENRAYTLSVGTSPRYRRKGVSKKLFQAVSASLKNVDASGAQLEVITSNEKAVASYAKLGFKRARTLGVFRVLKQDLRLPKRSEILLQTSSADQLPENDEDYFDTQPTPQNSREAIMRLRAKTEVVVAELNGVCAGWGAIYSDGAVAQIAVHKEHRRRGVGSVILRKLSETVPAETLSFVNVDENAVGFRAFLSDVGGEEVIRQYDMRHQFQ